MELGPISASLGAMGSLPWKLDELLATRHRALRGVVMDEIEELRNELHILHNLLLKLSNEQDPPPTARYWMKDVRELSYDMEDFADQFVHADARAKIRRATRRRTITRLKINRLPERRKWHPWITNKVSVFSTRAQEAIQRYWRYKFDDCASNPGYSRVGRERPTVYVEPGDLVGMEGPMNEIDRWLTNGEEQLKVVSIVGVGGVGKTTLAQKLWGKLRGQFDCRAFVRTAQKPDMRGILRSTLSQVRRHQSPDPGEMHHLIHKLREYLQDKRYFVIIDDLWATSVWDVISRAFPEGNCGSRIITTTEIMEVALACCGYCPEHIFKMETLSDDDSEKLLLQRILVSGNQSPQHFDDVLPQIMRICGGLPLAIIIVASLLASQPEKLEQWGCVQSSFGSNLRANPTMEGFMGEILNISFNSLPHYLKTCLLYLSTYPEGYIFLKDDLVKQWIAEGFICAKEGEDMEEIAGSYFDELVDMGLIQVMDINYNYELLSYSVHHMVLDLITYMSIEENFITVVDYSQTTIPLACKVRRLSLHFGSATYATTPASTRLSQVRSLFFFGLFKCMPSFVVFKLLRVLILHFWGDLGNTSFNLTGICELFWLRYLQVTCNVTVKLPDQIEAMKHLETLEINARVCAVPPDIVRLSSLLHLCLRGGKNLPDGIGCMRSLRTLKYFDLGNNSEDNLRGLGELTNLRDLHLTYSTSPSSEHLKRNLIALASSLGKLGNLKSLTLAPGTAGRVVLIDGLDGMSNPVFLERLELLPPICIFSILPIWFAQLDKICIMKVAVRELPRDDIDILAGLPSLTVLSLCVQIAPEGRIVFNDGAFPVLKYFKFSCGVLCMSFMSGAMCNLRRLKLCFNTHIREKYSNMLAGIEHLLNLQDITGRIGAVTESDRRAAESAIKDAISKHPRCPRFNVQWVDPVEEEYRPSEKQHGRQEKGSSGEKHGVLEKAEDMNKHADSGLSQLPDLPSAVASHRLKSERTAEASKHHVLESMLSDERAEPKSLELSLLEDITNNFSDDQEIGRSWFGVVYKGKLRNGSIVVVKRLAIAVDDKLFLDGVDCLIRVKHSNIVRFLGYYANTQENVIKEGGISVSGMMQERLLCFEYLCNGNLQMHLTDESCGFDWHIRYQIIKGICQGLRYLHDNCITHLDLKPDNILFDEKMVPKIVDYGYPRLLSEEISRTVLKNIGGSLAYMATPEYLGGGAITHKSDIYSLGVIIMQIVTGQNKKDCSNISGVLESWRSRLESDASQGHTSLETCYQQVKVCVEIGISCMDHDPGSRSITREIIHRLDKTEITERSVRRDVGNSPLEQMIIRSNAIFQSLVEESKAPPTPPAPPSVPHKKEMGLDLILFVKLQEAHVELENLREKAYHESSRRHEAEELIKYCQKTRKYEEMYFNEVRVRKEIEQMFGRSQQQIEELKQELELDIRQQDSSILRADGQTQQLGGLIDQLKKHNSALEQRSANADSTVKGLQGKLASARYQLDVQQATFKELKQERDAAVRKLQGLSGQTSDMAHGVHGATCCVFTSLELEQATDSFNELLMIGEGGFGRVYKGFLRSTTVAVKILHHENLQGQSQLQQEVVVLSRVRHPNLVALIGVCSEPLALVYEFCDNGSLEDRLMCKDDSPPLSCQVRIRIISEIFSALVFLHSAKPHPVVHGNLKPDNILLDANLVSKLSDFGISRILTSSTNASTLHYTTNPRGTVLYMDPEFLTTGELTPRSDVYSFGIIILQLLTGRSPLAIARDVEKALETNDLPLVLDRSAGEWPLDQARQLAILGLRCAELSRKNRPNFMDEVWREDVQRVISL